MGVLYPFENLPRLIWEFPVEKCEELVPFAVEDAYLTDSAAELVHLLIARGFFSRDAVEDDSLVPDDFHVGIRGRQAFFRKDFQKRIELRPFSFVPVHGVRG